jgi:hypothetical protein
VALGKLFAKPLVPAHAAFDAAAWKRLTRHISCPFCWRCALCLEIEAETFWGHGSQQTETPRMALHTIFWKCL